MGNAQVETQVISYKLLVPVNASGNTVFSGIYMDSSTHDIMGDASVTIVPAVTTTTSTTSTTSTTMPRKYCIDKDGSNIYTKGRVYGAYKYEPYEYSDKCISSRSVLEYTCKSNLPYARSLSCPRGYVCSNGACVRRA